MGDKLYVLGGVNGEGRLIKNIEVIDLAPREEGQPEAVFEAIETPAFTMRSNPVVCPIGADKLIICGGFKSPDILSDVILFDTEARTGEKIADAPFEISGLRNQTC